MLIRFPNYKSTCTRQMQYGNDIKTILTNRESSCLLVNMADYQKDNSQSIKFLYPLFLISTENQSSRSP